MGLDDLISCKAQLGREKDIKDIKKIKAYMKKQQSETFKFIPIKQTLAAA